MIMLVGDSLCDKALYLMFGMFQEESEIFFKNHTHNQKSNTLKLYHLDDFTLNVRDCLFIFEKKKTHRLLNKLS